MIFQEGSEVVIFNDQIGIIRSDGPIEKTNIYLVEIGKEFKKVSAENIVSSEEWSRRKLLSIYGTSIFAATTVDKEKSKLIFLNFFLLCAQ